MASLLTHDDLLYLSPSLRGEVVGFSFEDEIPEGDSIKAVAAGGTSVTAVNQDGVVKNDIVSEVAITGTRVDAKIKNLVNGQDYLVTYKARTEQSDEEFDKFLVVRCRSRGLYL